MLARMYRVIPYLIVATFLSVAASAQNTRPATAIRWDPLVPIAEQKPGPEPNPQTYTFSTYISAPRCIDVDEFGRIYILDAGRKVINRYSSTGEFVKQWVDDIHNAAYNMFRTPLKVVQGDQIFLGQGPFNYNIRRIGPNSNDDKIFPVNWDSSDSLMPCRDGSFFVDVNSKRRDEDKKVIESQILKFSAAGEQVNSWPLDPIHCMTMGPDGLIYVSPVEGKHIEVWNQDGKKLREISLAQTLGPNYNNPVGSVCVDYNGDIYFTDFGTIYRLDKDGNPLARWRPYGSDWAGPIAVKRGLVYVMTSEQHLVKGVLESRQTVLQVFNSSGKYLIRYLNNARPELELPIMTAVQPDGWHAVLQQGHMQGKLFDPSGKLHDFSPQSKQLTYVISIPGGGFLTSEYGRLYKYDSHGANGKLVYPATDDYHEHHSMNQPAYDPTTGDLWSVGWSGTLTHIKSDGEVIKKFPDCKPLCFKTWSVGTVIDHKGFIYLPNTYGHCIVKVDQEGNIVSTIGKKGSGLGELIYPDGITIDAQDRLYVADCGNNRIQVFDTDGKSLGFYGKRGKGDGEFDRPYGVTIAPDNTLWVADTFNDRIVKIPLADLWKQMNLEVKPEIIVEAPKRAPSPIAGKVTVVGIIVAGTDDFDDVVYLEDSSRAWAIEATLPAGKQLKRGAKCTLTGTLTVKARTPKHLAADTVEITEASVQGEAMPAPMGMSNQYVGDGYRNGDKPVDLSNLAMLITTWGKVIEVNEQDKLFVINDGTFKTGGLVVRVDNINSASFVWPKVDQYVKVTGISISYSDSEGSIWSGLRIRGQGDVALIQE